MSLFGKMPPFKPGMEIPPEVTVFLEGVIKNAGMNPDHYLSHNWMIEELYEDLEVGMFSEILTYLPGKHLNAFVGMNDQNRANLDEFLEKICQMQKKYLKALLPNSGSCFYAYRCATLSRLSD